LEDPDRLVERVVEGRDIRRWDAEGERVERMRACRYSKFGHFFKGHRAFASAHGKGE
jgi:hypothetical protein